MAEVRQILKGPTAADGRGRPGKMVFPRREV